MARTVIAMVRPERFGGELTEYERHTNLPPTWMPMPTCSAGSVSAEFPS
jgi:hypothetical protein